MIALQIDLNAVFALFPHRPDSGWGQSALG